MSYMRDANGVRLDSIGVPRGEVAYAEIIPQPANVTVDGLTAPAAIPGLLTTFTITRAGRFDLELYVAAVKNLTAGSGVVLSIRDASGVEFGRTFVKDGTANSEKQAHVRRRLTLLPATYTLGGYFGTWSGGTAAIDVGNAAWPAFLAVTEV